MAWCSTWLPSYHFLFDSKSNISRSPVPEWSCKQDNWLDLIFFFHLIQWSSVTSLAWTAQERGCSLWLMKQTWMKSWSLRDPSCRSKPQGLSSWQFSFSWNQIKPPTMGKKERKLDYTVWNWEKYVNTFPGDRTPAFLHSVHTALPKSSLNQGRDKSCTEGEWSLGGQGGSRTTVLESLLLRRARKSDIIHHRWWWCDHVVRKQISRSLHLENMKLLSR